MTEERGESYLEVQMDRSTIVLAALGFLACLVAAFLLGSWTATRRVEAERHAAELQASDAAEGDPATGEEDVATDAAFGGKPVSAAGAKPLTAVPPPEPAPASSGSVFPAGASSPRGITIATDDDDVEDVAPPAGSTPAKRAPATKPAPKPPGKPAPTKPAPAMPAASKPAPAASASADDGSGWVVQVGAVKVGSEAEAFKKRLTTKGYPVRVLEEGGYFKVQVGPYAEKSDALSAETKLKREGGVVATWVKKA